MFVVVSDIKIKPEEVEEFKKWFSEANKVVSKSPVQIRVWAPEHERIDFIDF